VQRRFVSFFRRRLNRACKRLRERTESQHWPQDDLAAQVECGLTECQVVRLLCVLPSSVQVAAGLVRVPADAEALALLEVDKRMVARRCA
jgi:hypothetical protein